VRTILVHIEMESTLTTDASDAMALGAVLLS
jgi:hypothetical protein